jgi:transposase
MQVVYQRCCGLDIHKKVIVACSITPEGKEIQSFGTMTEDILSLVEWVKSKRCSHVAMESTGVYWKPIYNVMELNEVEALVVNAQHIKSVPGRKTDVKDAEWIADLLRHGLLKGSYIPDRDQRELRELVRYRRSLIEERTREVNRLQKVLEGANIKLASVASNIMGASGRAMIDAILQDVNDPRVLASLAKGKLKSKKEALERALYGLIGFHQKMILSTQLEHIDFLDRQISKLDEEVMNRTRPFEEDLELLDSIPGIGKRSAEEIIAEIGTDMSRFPSAAQLASWAGMSPGQNESAGKRKSSRTRKGNNSLRRTLTEAARAAARTKETYLSAKYHRIAARRGSNRAAVAVGHTILVIIYNILKKRESYKDLGVDFLDKRKKDYSIKRSLKTLENLGVLVTISNTEVLGIAN